jgi:hypothetical protein
MATELAQQENANYATISSKPDQEPEIEQTIEPTNNVASGQQTVSNQQHGLSGKKKGAGRTNSFDALREELLKIGMDKENADKFVNSFKVRLMKDFQSRIDGSEETSKPNMNEAMGESTRFTTNDPFLTSFDNLTRGLQALKDLPEGPERELLLNLMIGHYFNQLQQMMYNQYYAPMLPGRGTGYHNGNGIADNTNSNPTTKLFTELLELKRASIMLKNLSKVLDKLDKLFPDEESENNGKEDKLLTIISEMKDMQKQFMDAITKMKEDENRTMMQKVIETLEKMSDNLANIQQGDNTVSTAKDPFDEVKEITQKTKAVMDSLADLGLIKKTKDEEEDFDKMTETIDKAKKILEASGRYRVEELPLTEERLAEIAKKKALEVLNNMDEKTLQDLVEKRGYTLQKKTLTREEVDALIADITKKVEEETRKKVEAEHKIELASNILAEAMKYVGPTITDFVKTLVGSSLQTALSANTPIGSNVNNNVSVSPNTNPSSNASTNTNPSPPTPGIQAKVTAPTTNVPPPSSASKTVSKAKQQKTDELQSLKDEEINQIQQLLR